MTLIGIAGVKVLTAVVMKSSIFCDITSYSLLKASRVSEVATCFIQVSRLACFSILKMEVPRSSVTSVDFKQATLRYIPEDRTLLIGVLALCQYHQTTLFIFSL
jgi:hypothetical protein